MKRLIKYHIFFLMLLTLGFLISCGEDEPEEPLLSKRTDITSFVFDELSPSISGNINTDDHTVTATVPFGTDVTSLSPTIEVSEKAEIAPASGVARDFTNPVTYIVTAEDGTTQEWTVTVNIADEELQPQLLLSEEPIWKFLASESSLPSWFAAENGERNLAYHDQSDVLFVTYNGDAVRLLNPTTGEDLGSLKDENSVITEVGSEVKIGDVEVTDDGQILASNITERPGTFRLYKWSTIEANAELYIEFTNDDYRLGESFNVEGDLSGDAIITAPGGRLFSGEARPGDNRILEWTVIDGVLNTTPEIITVSALQEPYFGTIPTALPRTNQPDTDLFINGNSISRPILIDNAGNVISTVQYSTGSLDVGFTNQMEEVEFQNNNFLIMVSPAGLGNDVFILNITDDLDVSEDELIITPGIPNSNYDVNQNATGDIAIKVSDDGATLTLFHLGTNTGLWAYKLTYGIPEG